MGARLPSAGICLVFPQGSRKGCRLRALPRPGSGSRCDDQRKANRHEYMHGMPRRTQSFQRVQFVPQSGLNLLNLV